MRFQWPGGVSVPAPSAQKRAMVDCSAVRVELVAAPSCLTSLKSAVYLALVRAGGPVGRNSELVIMQKGLRKAHCANKYGVKDGGVGTHAPGPLPEGGGTVAAEPSLARAARSWAATDSPQTTPAFFCGPSATLAREPW